MIRKEFSYITMFTNWVSCYATYCTSLTAQREGSWSATGRVRRAHHGAHGAPYITTLRPTTGFNVRQHPKSPLAPLFHPKGKNLCEAKWGTTTHFRKGGGAKRRGRACEGRDFVSYCWSGIFVMPVRLKQPEVSA
jgi:hypothetical protein